MARPKARTAIERGLLGGESGYMCTNCISRIPLISLWGVYNVIVGVPKYFLSHD